MKNKIKRRWRIMQEGESVYSTDGYGLYKMGVPMAWSGHRVLDWEVGRFFTRRKQIKSKHIPLTAPHPSATLVRGN